MSEQKNNACVFVDGLFVCTGTCERDCGFAKNQAYSCEYMEDSIKKLERFDSHERDVDVVTCSNCEAQYDALNRAAAAINEELCRRANEAQSTDEKE